MAEKQEFFLNLPHSVLLKEQSGYQNTKRRKHNKSAGLINQYGCLHSLGSI
jgi:hypothetical protein